MSRLMISNKASNGTSAGGGMHFNLPFPKAPDRPASGGSCGIEASLTFSHVGSGVPVVPIGLDDQPCLREHEVGLEPPEHGLVHLELQSALLKLVTQESFNGGHLSRENLAQSGLPPFLRHFLSIFRVLPAAQPKLAHLLSRLRTTMQPQYILARSLPHLRLKMGSAHLLSRFRRVFITFWPRHRMFNFNTRAQGSQ